MRCVAMNWSVILQYEIFHFVFTFKKQWFIKAL